MNLLQFVLYSSIQWGWGRGVAGPELTKEVKLRFGSSICCKSTTSFLTTLANPNSSPRHKFRFVSRCTCADLKLFWRQPTNKGNQWRSIDHHTCNRDLDCLQLSPSMRVITYRPRESIQLTLPKDVCSEVPKRHIHSPLCTRSATQTWSMFLCWLGRTPVITKLHGSTNDKWLVSGFSQSTTKNYIKAKNKLQSAS